MYPNRGGRINIARNIYDNMALLLVGGFSTLYVLCFIAKKINTLYVGRIISFFGKESFYIMSFHVAGLFLCNLILVSVGRFQLYDPRANTYVFENDFFLFFLYLAFGLLFPIVLIHFWRFLYKYVIRGYHHLLSCFSNK